MNHEVVLFEIHENAEIDSSIKVRKGSSTVYRYYFSQDDPDITDDNWGKALLIEVKDSSKLKLNTIIDVPNENIKVKGRLFGAWIGSLYYQNISGKLKFDSSDEWVKIEIIDSLYSNKNQFPESKPYPIVFIGNLKYNKN